MVVALDTTLIASFVIFGWRALLVTAVTTAACVCSSTYGCLLRKTPPDGWRPVRRGHGACCWPSTYPPPSRWRMAVIGSFVAIVVVKGTVRRHRAQLREPAVVARIVLSVSFTAAMTNYAAPGVSSPAQPKRRCQELRHAAGSSAPRSCRRSWTSCSACTPACWAGRAASPSCWSFAWLLVTPHRHVHHPGRVYMGTVIVCSLFTSHDVAAGVLRRTAAVRRIRHGDRLRPSPTTFKGQVIFAVGLGLSTCLIRFWGT